MSITREEANKCLKSLMRVLIIKGGDKYWPAKNTSRQDAYRALYEIQKALGTRRLVQGEALLENMQDLDLALSTFLTRGEIIGAYEEAAVDMGLVASRGDEEAAKAYEIIKAGLDALRGPTREQVEKVWRGGWIAVREAGCDPIGGYKCSRCKAEAVLDCNDEFVLDNFCPRCGAAMTDEAVEITMRRLEALNEN